MKVNVKHCPICSQQNDCGMDRKDVACWCTKESFPEEIFKQIPNDLRNKSCICKSCLEKHTTK